MWTDERVALLKKHWLEGLSASQIAKVLGGVTRNAVIGKVHRLGLSGRAEPSKPTKYKAPRQPRIPRRPPPPPRPFVQAPEGPGSATIHSLADHMCKWPIGDPQDPAFTFCGRSSRGTYCLEHDQVAHQPGTGMSVAQMSRLFRRYM